MSLVNVAYAGTLTWANPSLRRLEHQALVPMLGEHPVELGLKKPPSGDQRADILAFLNSLTDDALLHDSRFADPWTQAAQETR